MKHLALAVISKPQFKLMHELLKFVRSCGCNVIEMRWFNPGNEAIGFYLLGGNWNNIAKLEAGIPNIERKYEVTILPRRVELRDAQPDRLLYTIYIMALDRPGILEEVMGFLSGEDVEAVDINGYVFEGRYTKAPISSVSISIAVPSAVLISDFRERFIGFCDDLNLDATLEPDKS
ncbi:MAG: hypothetical protein A3F13_01720 [Gammaproteobacteria bacterium RIFCSPHIGHO2_12_FULL_40_19]|nr:MAG: hypothetical protein A3F13_01720 [Gammaproteobacteria bacterium RIFCSPHIGHO2_12_FULL_40_19]